MATNFGPHLQYTHSIRGTPYETSDVTSVKNDPIAFFVAKEDITRTFDVPDNTTQIMIYLDGAYFWEGESLLVVEGRLPTTRPRSLVRPIMILDRRPFADIEKDNE